MHVSHSIENNFPRCSNGRAVWMKAWSTYNYTFAHVAVRCLSQPSAGKSVKRGEWVDWRCWWEICVFFPLASDGMRNACGVIIWHCAVASDWLIRNASHTHVSIHFFLSGRLRNRTVHIVWCHIIKRQKLTLHAFTAHLNALRARTSRCLYFAFSHFRIVVYIYKTQWHKCATYVDNLSN